MEGAWERVTSGDGTPFLHISIHTLLTKLDWDYISVLSGERIG